MEPLSNDRGRTGNGLGGGLCEEVLLDTDGEWGLG